MGKNTWFFVVAIGSRISGGNMLFRILFFVLFFSGTDLTMAWADSVSGTGSPREHPPTSVDELIPSDRIRVRKTGPFGQNAEGEILAIDPNRILLFDSPDTVKVDLTRRYNIQFYAGSKNKMGKGALVGATVGGVLGLIVGLSMLNSEGWFSVESEEAVGIIAVGTVGGGLVGGLIGLAYHDPVWVDLPFAQPQKETHLGLNIRF